MHFLQDRQELCPRILRKPCIFDSQAIRALFPFNPANHSRTLQEPEWT